MRRNVCLIVERALNSICQIPKLRKRTFSLSVFVVELELFDILRHLVFMFW